jgi:hypothetical protein
MVRVVYLATSAGDAGGASRPGRHMLQDTGKDHSKPKQSRSGHGMTCCIQYKRSSRCCWGFQAWQAHAAGHRENHSKGKTGEGEDMLYRSQAKDKMLVGRTALAGTCCRANGRGATCDSGAGWPAQRCSSDAETGDVVVSDSKLSTFELPPQKRV